MKPYPEILFTNIAGNTNAVVNTATDLAIVAAPGVGARIRVFYVDWVEQQNNAANVLRSLLFDGVSIANTVASSAIQQNRSDNASFYPQGVPLDENTALVNRSLCTVASLPYRVSVHYAIEAV